MVSKSAKGNKGQYFTPRYVIEFCVRMMEPSPEETVLDPACGSGGFLFNSLDFIRKNNALSSIELNSYCSTKLWGFDIDPKAIKVAKALMILAGHGVSNVVRLNSLVRSRPNGSSFTSPDGSFLTVEDITRARLRHHKGFDVILTNPPFAGEVLEQHILEKYDAGRGKTGLNVTCFLLSDVLIFSGPVGEWQLCFPIINSQEWNLVKTGNGSLRNAGYLQLWDSGVTPFASYPSENKYIIYPKESGRGCW